LQTRLAEERSQSFLAPAKGMSGSTQALPACIPCSRRACCTPRPASRAGRSSPRHRHLAWCCRRSILS